MSIFNTGSQFATTPAPSSSGFGGGFFDQFYSQYTNAPIGQGQPSIQKGVGQGTLVDLGGGMFGMPLTPTGRTMPSSFGAFGQSPMNIYSGTDLQNRFNENTGRAQYAAALMADYENLVAAGQQQGQRMQQALGNMQNAYVGGAQNIRGSGQQAFQDMAATSNNLMDMGNQFLAQQTDYNKGVLAESDRLFQEAIDNYSTQFSDDASSIALGQARQTASQRNALEAEAKMGNPQAQMALDQLDFQTQQQTQQTMTGLANQYNQAKASMGMARAQNYGQVGMQAGSNINQAGSIRNQLAGIASEMYQQGVVMRQSAEVMANQFLAQGMKDSFQAVAQYPGSPVSIAAIFSQLFQFDMTPGTSGLTGMPSEYLNEAIA